jgi:formimidoylglutamase
MPNPIDAFCVSPPAETKPSADRFASLVRDSSRASRNDSQIALIGLPDDLGVRFNRGRPGASEGPRAFRSVLARYGVASPAGWSWPRVCDLGDIVPAQGEDEHSLVETHARITRVVEQAVSEGLFPIGIGGGHDLTFPFVRGACSRQDPGGEGADGFYLDAHLDVRETIGSGMPFRRLIEGGFARSLTLVGMNPLANASEHVAWFEDHGGRATSASGFLETLASNDHPAFASLDLDVLDGSQAPGVSAINPCGLTSREIAPLIEALGKSRRVRCFDIMELNPSHDQDGRTARVAVHMLLTFLKGFATRSVHP